MQQSNGHRLAGVSARLARAREEYLEAMAAERDAKERSNRLPRGIEDAREPIQNASQRTKLAAEEYDGALKDFIKVAARRNA